MRFLIGVLCGGALSAVTYLQWPEFATWLPARGEQLANALKTSGGSTLRTAGQAPPAAPTPMPESAPPLPIAPATAREPSPASAPQVARGDLPPEQPEVAPEPDSPLESGSEVIWDSFRSEVTARGFAEFMARQTGRRFEVQPLGLGQYQVVYHYVSEEDRQAALRAVGNVAKHGVTL